MKYTESKIKELKDFIEKLKVNGFEVYAPEPLTTYCNFVKDNKIGYVERSYSGFNFSTVHKPNTDCGTNFSIHSDIDNPTIKMAEDCFLNTPHWGTGHASHVIKYSSWKEYINYPTNDIIKKVKM